MNTTHTPGPLWHATYHLNAWEIRESNESLVTHIPGGKTDADAESTARLIASAPALLAEVSALKARCAELERAMANACQNTVNGNGRIQRLETALQAVVACDANEEDWNKLEWLEEVQAAIDTARAALAGKGAV